MVDGIILGDFNAHTRDQPISLHNRSKDSFCLQVVDPASLDLHRVSNDALGLLSIYNKHPLHLGDSYELLILNVRPYFPASTGFNCFLHKGGVSAVDYVLTSQYLISFIHQFSITHVIRGFVLVQSLHKIPILCNNQRYLPLSPKQTLPPF
jgi:hypothetical protein